jgi:hypothetical protein
MGRIEVAGIRAGDRQSTAEGQMIEIELIVLATMPAEVRDVIEPVIDRAVDEAVEPVAAGQRVVAALTFDKVVSPLPVIVSSKSEPRTRETPLMNVSVPTESSPVAVPDPFNPSVTVTPAVALS